MAMMVCGIPECYRPRHERGGIIHDFCSRTHAQEAADRGMIDQLRAPHGDCHRCQLSGCYEEVFFEEDTNRVHDFCCLSHAQEAEARGEWPPPGTQGSYTCQLPGCDQWTYRNPVTGEESAFCGRSHLEMANQAPAAPASQSFEMSNQPPAAPAAVCGRPYCNRPTWMDESSGYQLAYCGSRCAYAHGAQHLVGQTRCSLPGCNDLTMLNDFTGADMGYCCHNHLVRAEERSLCANPEPNVDRTFRGGPSDDFKLSVLTKRHDKYLSIKQQFLSKFQKPVIGLRVERIFKIQVPSDVWGKYKAHEQMMGAHTTSRRFHGTSCSVDCNFFVDLMGGPCGRPDCSVCSICTHGFKLQGFLGRTAQRTRMHLRYGQGLYFSSVSGKANDYAFASEKPDYRSGKKWRCMFICNVVVGRAYSTTEGFLPPQMCPPQGYDSVIGEVGQNLNYDEVVVYREEAALPTYLVAYSFF